MARRTVAVVGGGCAGVLATREILRCTDDAVVVIEPDEPGGGLAYGHARPWHLLNSRAGAMKGLLRSGRARVGPHGLGLDIDDEGWLAGARGRTLWLIGPLRRGARWETTAVPEIRDQARKIAAAVTIPIR